MSKNVHQVAELNALLQHEGAEVAMSALEAAVARTRRLDRLDVLSGKRSADALHFISRSMARQTKPVFPVKYRKS